MNVFCPECPRDAKSAKKLSRLYYRVGAKGAWKRAIGYGYCKCCGKVYLVDGDK